MWLCPKCNKENEDRMIFCAQCGFDESKNYEKYRVFTRLLQEQGETYSSLFKTANQDQEKLSENLSKSSENITWNVSLDTPENVQKGKKSKNYFGKIEIFAYLITILTAYFWGPMVITSVLGIFLMKFGKKEYFKQNNRVGIFWIFMGSWFNVVCFPVLVLGNIPLGFALSIMTTTAAIHCKKRINR